VSTFFQTVWRDGHALETEADVARALARAVPDVNVAAVLAEARTDAAKDRLRLATEAALAAGVFGV
jgi:2-hydroxychromene-2-carboxylate isomerase